MVNIYIKKKLKLKVDAKSVLPFVEGPNSDSNLNRGHDGECVSVVAPVFLRLNLLLETDHRQMHISQLKIVTRCCCCCDRSFEMDSFYSYCTINFLCLMTNTDDFLGTTHINNSSSPTPFSLFR
jgi:hypothetical protein